MTEPQDKSAPAELEIIIAFDKSGKESGQEQSIRAFNDLMKLQGRPIHARLLVTDMSYAEEMHFRDVSALHVDPVPHYLYSKDLPKHLLARKKLQINMVRNTLSYENYLTGNTDMVRLENTGQYARLANYIKREIVEKHFAGPGGWLDKMVQFEDAGSPADETNAKTAEILRELKAAIYKDMLYDDIVSHRAGLGSLDKKGIHSAQHLNARDVKNYIESCTPETAFHIFCSNGFIRSASLNRDPFLVEELRDAGEKSLISAWKEIASQQTDHTRTVMIYVTNDKGPPELAAQELKQTFNPASTVPLHIIGPSVFSHLMHDIAVQLNQPSNFTKPGKDYFANADYHVAYSRAIQELQKADAAMHEVDEQKPIDDPRYKIRAAEHHFTLGTNGPDLLDTFLGR